MLTDAQKDELLRLREDEGESYGRLAKRFSLSVSSVAYHCLMAGVEKPGDRFPLGRNKAGAVEQRNGRPVRRFSAEEDAMLRQQSTAGLNNAAIGRLCVPPRRPHTILARLATLARHDARAERVEAARASGVAAGAGAVAAAAAVRGAGADRRG